MNIGVQIILIPSLKYLKQMTSKDVDKGCKELFRAPEFDNK